MQLIWILQTFNCWLYACLESMLFYDQFCCLKHIFLDAVYFFYLVDDNHLSAGFVNLVQYFPTVSASVC